MKTLRTALALLTVGLLAVGYAVSQYARFNGWGADYASRVDTPAVSNLALALLALIAVLGVIKDSKTEDKKTEGPEADDQ